MIIKKYLEKEKEGKQQCQNCLEFGHWTYECTRPQTYVYRPSRTKLFKQNKFNLFNIKDQKREDSPKKEEEKKDKNKSISYSSSDSYSSSSSGSNPRSHSSSSGSSYSSSSSSFSRSDSENLENKDEIIQNKKRQKLNEMLDNLQKNENKNRKKNRSISKSRSKSRSRSRHHHHRKRDRDIHRRRSRSRSRSDSSRRKMHRKNEDLMNNYKNKNSFYGEYKLKKGERWKKIAEIEQEEGSNSPGRGRNGAFRKRPYQ